MPMQSPPPEGEWARRERFRRYTPAMIHDQPAVMLLFRSVTSAGNRFRVGAPRQAERRTPTVSRGRTEDVPAAQGLAA